MCGIFGCYDIKGNTSGVTKDTYYGAFSLQHRGQESAGIVVNDDGLFTVHKDSGLVNEVFSKATLESLGQGNMAIGHVRYGTLGTKQKENAEPIVINHMKGRLAISTGGRLVNAAELKSELEMQGMIFHTTSDAEIVSYVITKERLTSSSIEEAVAKSMDKLKGGYCILKYS